MKSFFYSIAFLFLCFNIYAQEEKTYTLSIDSKDSVCKADILYKKKLHFKCKNDRTYYWTNNHDVFSTQGGYDGRLLHGKYRVFYKNQNLKEKSFFRKGLKVRKSFSWHDNGKLKEIAHWCHGAKYGKYETFDENGMRTLKANYRNNKLQGCYQIFKAGVFTGEKKYKNGTEVPPKSKKVKEKKNKEANRTSDTGKKENAWTKVKGWFKKKPDKQTSDSKSSVAPVEEKSKKDKSKEKKDDTSKDKKKP